MAKDKLQMPQSTAGLVRYYEETTSAIKLKPEHIVIACSVIIAIEIALRFLF